MMLWLVLLLPILSVTSRSISIDHRSQSNTIADRIIELVTQGEFRGVTYNRLAALVDTIGPRLCGNESLTNAVNWVQNAMINEGLDNVHVEEVQIPHWVRGEEHARLIQPRNAKLSMLGLGNSVGTGPNGIQAPVLVVRSFDELNARCGEARNKIVVFNPQCDWQAQPIGCYGPVVGYRVGGASHAAKCGALASLSRSAASRSIDSPHTGVMEYDLTYPKIPAASLSVEHADMLDRFQQRNQSMEIFLYMEAQTLSDVVGYNLVAEVKGSTLPNETVLVSGHLDSWDVGQGAMDDGGGAAISWTVLSLIHALNIRAKRTIRCVLWSCEEFGGIGGDQYFTAHQNEVPNMSIVMESDLGVFHPQGLQFQGRPEAQQIVTTISKLLTSINATQVVSGGGGEDISKWMQHGVPGASLLNDNWDYFAYHHSRGDTINVLNSTDVDLAAAVWTVYAFSIADLDSILPR
ncbi:unnamed protein product [Rotaria magnacalcarata]|uniref:Carboxypeptidase Q n=3 Tax=Rotaria magnacalcarata TaxID=392030 RepID=A0A814MC41_9BILA|nr:unnamed protein product [Rotaria magnacalcarata]CAF2079660.1 unnamed protein product [Rotaria magnacalcarata]CAF3846485.1 unnamed protein product [Rotaria magnacalcarata]CAF3889608.1 unnamed protein product [Rotaria magnacalcarata]